MTKINSSLRSFGGKSNMLKSLYEHFPPNDSYSSYIEPFMGSLVVGLNMNNPKCSSIVNDLNKNIYSFFKVLQDKEMFERMKSKLDLIFYSEDIFDDSLQWLKEAGQEDGYSIEDRAYHFFIVNRMSYSGNNLSFGKNMAIRRGVSKSVSDMLSTIDGMQAIHEKIQNFIILNRDALDLIEHYDNPDYFYYLDSPYVWSTRTNCRYPIDMDDSMQERYVNILAKGKSKYLVSGYDNELYEEVLVKKGGWSKHSFVVNTVTGTNSAKSKVEVLWKNY